MRIPVGAEITRLGPAEGDGITQAPNVALNLAHFRKYITEAETDLEGHTPLIVFDNHDNTRSWDRFTTPGETPSPFSSSPGTALVTATSPDRSGHRHCW